MLSFAAYLCRVRSPEEREREREEWEGAEPLRTKIVLAMIADFARNRITLSLSFPLYPIPWICEYARIDDDVTATDLYQLHE